MTTLFQLVLNMQKKIMEKLFSGIFGFLKLKWKHVISNQEVLQITWQSNDALSKELSLF